MAIPEISKANVLAAIERIQKEGVPRSRLSTRYDLLHEGMRYPPKYVVSLAVQNATGRELDPEEFSGGVETNSLLRLLGFSVVAFSRDAVDSVDTRRLRATSQKPRKRPHGEVEHVPSSFQTKSGVPLIGRVVVPGQPGNPSHAEAMLFDLLANRWPQRLSLKFLITPGGFAVAPFPALWDGGTGWYSSPSDLQSLQGHAEKVLRKVLTERVLNAAHEKTEVLTIGIDVSSDHRPEHAELVAVCELASRSVHWTGKSYPTGYQERHLVQVADIQTHLLELAGERVLVLGCHDLNMFSPRARANQAQGSLRWKRCEAMERLVKRFSPTVVLHHPHSTDSPNIWRTAWTGVIREFPDLKAWASGIAYFNWGGFPRGELDKVLAATHGGVATVDFIASVR
ncbi:MAG: hypothetical protein ACLQPD_35350 [Desulfomonilaceae bacterium]